MANILTVYYSRKGENYFPEGIKSIEKGNTEIAAEFIHKTVGGDIFEIDTVKPYSKDYYICCDEAKAELKENARPEIKAFMEDISAYDTIFVCYPNWWGTVPMCILTFLDNYDLTDKKILPLCTNEGSNMGKSETDLVKSYRKAVVKPGLAVRGHKVKDSEAEIARWAKNNI